MKPWSPDKLRRIQGLRPDLVEGAVPFGVRVIVLAKVVRQLKNIVIILLCLTIIASSLFGLGLLVVTATKPTLLKKMLKPFSEDVVPKEPNSMPEVLPPLDQIY